MMLGNYTQIPLKIDMVLHYTFVSLTCQTMLIKVLLLLVLVTFVFCIRERSPLPRYIKKYIFRVINNISMKLIHISEK